MADLPARRFKKLFGFGEARFFKGNGVRSFVKHGKQYLQKALYARADDDLLRRADDAAGFVAVTRKGLAQVGFALWVAVTGKQRRVLQCVPKAAFPHGGGEQAAVDVVVAKIVTQPAMGRAAIPAAK